MPEWVFDLILRAIVLTACVGLVGFIGLCLVQAWRSRG